MPHQPSRPSMPDPSDELQTFEAGRYALLVTQRAPGMPAHKAEFDKQRSRCERFTRRKLQRRGVGGWLPLDLKSATDDVVQEYSLRLCEVRARALQTMHAQKMSVPALLSSLSEVLDRYRPVEPQAGGLGEQALATADTADANVDGEFDDSVDAAADDGPVAKHRSAAHGDASLKAANGAKRAPSPGSFVLLLLGELHHRVLTTSPLDFVQQSESWSAHAIETLMHAALHRLNGYSITILLRLCSKTVKEAARALETTESYDESEGTALPGEHDLLAHYQREMRPSAPLSPYMSASFSTRCNKALQEVDAARIAAGKDALCLDHLEALIRSMQILLDAPDENGYALARQLLEIQGRLSDKDIHRGLAAAMRHPIYRRLKEDLEAASKWDPTL